ncbi:TetR/AcrR family transcriptional repressor of nem operon [Chitinivorax tropicus]|uniref:TetR/AcrR family transcriptional repressor of nem operon n=1 Tax=Chitinivorax tropicus TaxID=714531 RepID=A0A840MMC6_9PROT|nr:TetR/AcrR family transcriptional regulator [Chitinivorax tropicus]MBB5018279.1 TetR/AcrR family transcriptional repressor of nem operon [Chitinivorax tropicus]
MSAPAKTDTKKRILDLAEELLLTRSFSAFSYQHISATLGVKNAAIHYHFPSKTDLGVALIQRYRRRFARWTAQQETLAGDPWQKLEWYFDLVVRYYDQNQRICPTGVLSAEYLVLPPEMQAETQAFMQELLAWAELILIEGQNKGYFRFKGIPRDRASTIMAALQGGLQVARVMENSTILDDIIKQIRLGLGAGGQLA